MNWHLARYFQDRPKKVGVTRLRPCHKGGNRHVEEKNWTRVRQLLGYERMEDPAVIEPLNVLYREVCGPLHNFLCRAPSWRRKSVRESKFVGNTTNL